MGGAAASPPFSRRQPRRLAPKETCARLLQDLGLDLGTRVLDISALTARERDEPLL